MDGWVKLHRKIMDNPLYLSEPFTRMQAWIDLLLLANHKDGFFYVRGNKVTVGRGQIGTSSRTLASRWQWSRGKVERFLDELEQNGQIKPQKTNVITLISICNYIEYQEMEPQNEPQTDHRQTTDEPQKSPNKKDKNVNNENNDKKKSKKAGFDYSKSEFSFIESEEMKEIFLEWLDYKKETHKFSYKTERSLEAAYNELLKLSGGKPGLARAIVNQSIANGWKGLFPYKGANNGQTMDARKNSPTQLDFEKAGSDPGSGSYHDTL